MPICIYCYHLFGELNEKGLCGDCNKLLKEKAKMIVEDLVNKRKEDAVKTEIKKDNHEGYI